MKILDKLLLATATISLTGIILILSTEELSSEYANHPNEAQLEPVFSAQENGHDRALYQDAQPGPHANRANTTNGTNADGDGVTDEHADTMIIYSDDVDEIIETYFKSIRENPDQLEEENRLIEEGPFTRVEAPALQTIEEELTSKIEESRANPNLEDSLNQETQNVTQTNSLSIQNHVVSKGESLWRISQKYNVPIYTIVSLNPKSANKTIQPGDTLRISNVPGLEYKVNKGDTLSAIAAKHKIATGTIIEFNNLTTDIIHAGDSIFLPGAKQPDQYIWTQKNRFIWPVSGRITSKYGNRTHPVSGKYHLHTGLDIAANKGTAIKAAADGVVLFSGDGGSYGKMVVLRHKDNYITVYAHASKLNVKKGAYVKQGQKIAEVGSTGVTTGNHLHFEVKKSNKRMDPLNALNEKVKVKTPVS